MIPISCPSDVELTNYCLGALESARLDEVSEHLDSCPACATRLTGFSVKVDPLAEAVRRAGQVAAFTSAPPTALRDYRLEDVLGEGGMGTVYRAVHTRLGRPVALKLLTARRRLDPNAATRFEREMRAIGALRHSNIVQATDAGEVDGVPFLVMELLDGRDLSRIVHVHGPLSVADACEATRQTALALQHAHEHGLVHRDVKPSNLMLTTDGAVKLLDLGLARSVGLGSEEPSGGSVVVGTGELTDTQTRVGTENYMAPEQRSAPEHVTLRADLYALGRTLAFLLTGAPDRSVVGIVPAALTKIMQRLLAERQEDRYDSAAAVATALKPYCRESDLGALVGKPRPRSSRRAFVLALMAALALLGIGVFALLGGFASDQIVTESSQAAPAPAIPEVLVKSSSMPMPRAMPPAGKLGMKAGEAPALQKRCASHLGQEIIVRDGLGIDLVLVPPGEVVLKNVTTVIITRPYRLGATEITRAQFQAFVTVTGYQTDGERRGGGKYIWQIRTDAGTLAPKEKFSLAYSWRTPGYEQVTDTDPVTQVSWNDAVAFCKWLSDREGKHYRLPTVAEQTWAARAGEATANPGDIVGRLEGIHLNEFAWTNRKTPMQPQPVAKLKPNAWGLYDTVGNVAEWCQDRSGPLPGGLHLDYAGTDRGLLRLLVGGSYREFGAYGYFEMNTPDARNSKTGFRVVREP